MSIKYTRVHRLLEIISLVQSQRGWTAKTLAEKCETTERNIYRDINQIKEAGIPNLEMQFPSALSVNTLDEEVIDAMCEAGMNIFYLAICFYYVYLVFLLKCFLVFYLGVFI